MTDTMTDEEPLTDEDVAALVASAEADGQCEHPGCTLPRRPYGGKGKRPTTCEQHRPGAPKGGSPVGRSPKAADAKMIAGLEELVTLVGMGVSFWDAYDGQVICAGAAPLARQLVSMGDQYPAVKRVLAKVAGGAVTAQSGLGLTMVVAQMAVPIMVHHGTLPADRMPSMLMRFAPVEATTADPAP